MELQYHFINFKPTENLKTFAKKVEKIEKFYDPILNADLYLKLEKASDVKTKIVELHIKISKKSFIIKKEETSFKIGIDKVLDSCSKTLRREKDKLITKKRRG